MHLFCSVLLFVIHLLFFVLSVILLYIFMNCDGYYYNSKEKGGFTVATTALQILARDFVPV